MILADWQIKKRALDGMIDPFQIKQIRQQTCPDGMSVGVRKVISYGLSSYGYDARLGNQFKIFTNAYGAVVDPKNFDPQCFVEKECDDYCIVPANSFALGTTLETFDIPRDILVLCIGKSTYARCGILVTPTPLEPEWRGQVTLEISNMSQCPAKVYVGEGIFQMVFLKGDVCEVSYADRKGKYQDQSGVVVPKV